MPNEHMKVSASITIKTPNSTVQSHMKGALDLANEAVHVLVQDVGTNEAKRLLLKRLEDYPADYLGYHVEPEVQEGGK